MDHTTAYLIFGMVMLHLAAGIGYLAWKMRPGKGRDAPKDRPDA